MVFVVAVLLRDGTIEPSNKEERLESEKGRWATGAYYGMGAGYLRAIGHLFCVLKHPI